MKKRKHAFAPLFPFTCVVLKRKGKGATPSLLSLVLFPFSLSFNTSHHTASRLFTLLFYNGSMKREKSKGTKEKPKRSKMKEKKGEASSCHVERLTMVRFLINLNQRR